jgi:hypothetical protein
MPIISSWFKKYTQTLVPAETPTVERGVIQISAASSIQVAANAAYNRPRARIASRRESNSKARS